MSQDFASAIAAVRVQLSKKEQEVRHAKKLINDLCRLAGEDAPYPDAEQDAESTGNIGNLRRDEFYGKPLAGAIRDYLRMRRNAGIGPATVSEIHATLTQGGFIFETKNAENAKRALYISLGKNATVFHKLPGGDGDSAAVFGLKEWYPNARSDADTKPKGKPKKRVHAKNKAVGSKSPTPPKVMNSKESNSPKPDQAQ